jgi:hypothetical protein
MVETKGTAESSPTVVEAYRDYAPPPAFRRLVQNLLKAVPPRYFLGLKTIILTNQAGESRDRKRQKVWSRNRKIRLVDARGYYSPCGRLGKSWVVASSRSGRGWEQSCTVDGQLGSNSTCLVSRLSGIGFHNSNSAGAMFLTVWYKSLAVLETGRVELCGYA